MLQVGARQNYSIATRFLRLGCPVQLVTDMVWAISPDAFPLDRVPGWLGRLADRRPGLPYGAIETLPAVVALRALEVVRTRRGWLGYDFFAREGRLFAELASERIGIGVDLVWTFTSAAKEVIEVARRRRQVCVLDVIDPGPREEAIVAQERASSWLKETETEPVTEAFYERVRAEWHAAEVLVVNSAWTRSCLRAEGVPDEKTVIVPLDFEGPLNPPIRTRWAGSRPLRCVWVGTACLRKGLRVLVEAARELEREPVEIDVYGDVKVDLRGVSLPRNVCFHGVVGHGRVPGILQQSDLFVFPTLSDGFGRAQLEAAAYGCPVIATERCGDVVEDGRSGIVIEAGSVSAFVSAVRRILDRELCLESLSLGAVERAKRFSPMIVATEMVDRLRRHEETAPG